MDEENRFKNILMIACTEKAWELVQKTESGYREEYPDAVIETAVKCRALEDISITESLEGFVGRHFGTADAIIFFSAAGIAVRTIAPFVKDKYSDPAVLVVDETGRFCISLLSGHVGGANDLCLTIAEILGAEPVITTATDRLGRFSVDSFAMSHGLGISDRILAKEISAKVVSGQTVKMYIRDLFKKGKSIREKDLSVDAPGMINGAARRLYGTDREYNVSDSSQHHTGNQENGVDSSLYNIENQENSADSSLYRTENRQKEIYRKDDFTDGLLLTENREEAEVIIDIRREIGDRTDALYLIPKRTVIGIGCRRGKAEEDIAHAVKETLEADGIFRKSVCCIASIDLKADEPGLVSFAKHMGVPFRTFRAEELEAAGGTFSSSEFVQQVTGVDNVCERAAVAASDGGTLIVKKQIYKGVTVAATLKV